MVSSFASRRSVISVRLVKMDNPHAGIDVYDYVENENENVSTPRVYRQLDPWTGSQISRPAQAWDAQRERFQKETRRLHLQVS